MRALITIVMVLMVFAPAAFAQTDDQAGNTDVKKHYLYEWTDSKGGVHITDDLGEVPKRYRSKARKIETPKGQEQVQGRTQSSSGAATEQQETASKAVWQQRIQDWKEQLADAQKRYRDLDQKRRDALGMWGGSATGHLEGRAEAEKIQKEMDEVQLDIDEAKNMIETVIPEEARKAGIPPGWLRE